MKQITNFIKEGLKITSKTRVNEVYHPKDRNELKELIEKLLDERGEDANLNDIDTSEITDMSELFYGLDPHNIDISKWDVSKVIDMSWIFYRCYNFNSDLSKWDVSNVKDMYGMFDNTPLEKNSPQWYWYKK